ncbi:hypothetical protein [Pelagibaculum spongiae]|uniref:Uncharacterized protein n=1 Tax=Pelagibaculum spongiae TaxID=2080658 RepID=A0A2V1GS12_9GAMM|nr:hypothetical protein [Pelagibaculum spongiae]PVZ65647.1 hypothetical protein DC094_17320 [Pelagibaculum spongiae]
MVYQLTDADLKIIQFQQLTQLRNQLIEHLLTLPNPPTDWAVLEPVLIPQIRALRQFGLLDIESLKLAAEALHYQPDLLQTEQAKQILEDDIKPFFAAEALLDLAQSSNYQEQKSQRQNLQQLNH